MDPLSCLLAAQDAIRDGDLETAADHLDNYRNCRRRGGFEPAIHGTRGDTFARQLMIDVTAALAASDR